MTIATHTSQKGNALIFVDFDGVLHRRDGRWFERLPLLIGWLETNPHVRVIVSSSHREHTGFSRLRGALPAAVRSHLVGQTPRMGRGRWDPPVPFVRQREVEAYLRELAEPSVPFAVLDDDVSLFYPSWQHLIRTDGRVGVTADDFLLVDRLLESQRLGTTELL